MRVHVLAHDVMSKVVQECRSKLNFDLGVDDTTHTILPAVRKGSWADKFISGGSSWMGRDMVDAHCRHAQIVDAINGQDGEHKACGSYGNKGPEGQSAYDEARI